MTESLLQEDAAARQRALALESFVVEAPAGAGKTELLIQRLLKLLAAVDAPEEIVAITFTNKAAAEMKRRIALSLVQATANEAPLEAPLEVHRRITFDLARAALAHGQARGWGELAPRLSILTIDALCAKLARQLPLLSRFGGEPQLVEDATRHYAAAAQAALRLLDEGDAALSDIVAAALRHVDNDALRLGGLLAQMLGKRDQWLPHSFALEGRAAAEAALEKLLLRDLRAAAAAFTTALQTPLMPLARFAAAHVEAGHALAPLCDWQTPLTGAVIELPQWRALCALLLTLEGVPRKQVNKNTGFPADKKFAAEKEAMLAWLKTHGAAAAPPLSRLPASPPARYSDEEWAVIENLSALLRIAAAQLWTVFHSAGEVDFVEVAQRALSALSAAGEPSDLALALDYRIRHLLVDEFQDTSPAQVELLRQLTAGWAAQDGRTLFAVGDPMQSIYRFRKADVGLFLRVTRRGINDFPLTRLRLNRNNRSCGEVVDWINQHFASIFPAQDDMFTGAIRYRPFAPTRAPLPEAGVFVHPLRVVDVQQSDALEARRIVELIGAIHKDDATREIAVLVRTRRHVAALAAALRRQGVAFQAVDIERLGERQIVQDLLTLTAALLHRADRVQWLALLRAPCCGLLLADLHALAHDDQRATIWQLMHDEARLARLSADGRARLLHVRGVVEQAYAHQGRMRPRRWIEGVWLRLGFTNDNPQDRQDVETCLDLIDRLDAAGRFTAEEFASEIEKLHAAPPAGDVGKNLQLMTMHKAKGLEFDTVILPGLHHASRSDDPPLVMWEEVLNEEEGVELLAASLGRRGDEGEGASLYQFLRRLERERAAFEAARVLYVAATRAIRALHLFGAVADKNGDVAPPPGGSFLGLLWDGVAQDFAAAPLTQDDTLADEKDGEGDGGLARYAAQLERLTLAAPPANWPDAAADMDAPVPQTLDAPHAAADSRVQDALAAHVGTLVHLCLELIAGDVEAWPAARLQTLRPVLLAWLRRHGHSESDAETGLTRCLAALTTTLESEDGRWTLAARPAAATEFVLTVNEDNRAITRVVDRSFVEQGVRWIIDYKTAWVAEAEANQDALVRHAERYRPQLQGYARLFADESLPQKLAIFYARHGRLAVLPSVG